MLFRSQKQMWTLERRDDRNKTFLGAITANFSEFEEELEPAPQHFEEGVTLTAEHLLEVDLGDASQRRPTFIGTGLSEIEKRDLIEMLKENINCFAWSYDEMSGLAPEIAQHHLSVREAVKPVQQSKRKYSPVIEN